MKALGFVVPFAIFLLQVYPIVSAVWGHCEITMKYLGEFSAGMFRPFKLVCCTCKTRILFPKNLGFFLRKIFLTFFFESDLNDKNNQQVFFPIVYKALCCKWLRNT